MPNICFKTPFVVHIAEAEKNSFKFSKKLKAG
jgi:hypothetical protein